MDMDVSEHVRRDEWVALESDRTEEKLESGARERGRQTESECGRERGSEMESDDTA